MQAPQLGWLPSQPSWAIQEPSKLNSVTIPLFRQDLSIPFLLLPPATTDPAGGHNWGGPPASATPAFSWGTLARPPPHAHNPQFSRCPQPPQQPARHHLNNGSLLAPPGIFSLCPVPHSAPAAQPASPRAEGAASTTSPAPPCDSDAHCCAPQPKLLRCLFVVAPVILICSEGAGGLIQP